MKTLSLAFALLFAALPALADPIPLAELSRYLNGIETAQGRFTQVNGDRSVSTGTVYIRRPGRIRFEYDPPNDALVMAGGGQVAVFDPKSNQPPEQYPLSRTPLSLILDRQVDLRRARMVVGYGAEGSTTRVTAQDPDNPDYGTLTLFFADDPVRLVQWVVDDGSGSPVRVALDDLETGVSLGASLFNIVLEARKRGED
ncbi:outer membrane lipoprotein-sorting protein [Rhodovulum iodosum]|uniref:Outer membrane lipoprotein-sorting protein n=1 Tax=Rhodovulum iodosum TaxID=68291 RepID=A0ABV3XSQ4_9RHOB|nr:outer membrane lipoprotein carrier protein LolA [Rhodovulum robiginosum]RSK30442.1 outer membrane lipoprotein carrier protein LolA [Rhodovulum robiginosum]